MNASQRSTFEFSFDWKENGNSSIFNITTLKDLFDSVPNQYGLKIKLLIEANSSIYSIKGNESSPRTIVIFVVEKTA